ncbi:MAG: metallophosphoesterase family protein [Planctomycetes bacterium]|nr:metallophosphoesterase family protein [Planctomycetota bacterium]
MRTGIISDIHANWQAMQAALARLDKEGVDEIVCLGDVIGYGADPKICVEEIMRRRIVTIRGNHERYVIGEIEDGLKADTEKAIEYTRAQLKNEHYTEIESWKNRLMHRNEFLMTHGSPRHKDEYVLSIDAVVGSLRALQQEFPDCRVALHGHTHLTSLFAPGQVVKPIHEDLVAQLDFTKVYLLNPGSVGQPRDRCPLASFMILDMERKSAQYFREPYDIEGAQKRIREAGLAERFAMRLQDGT